MAKALKKTEQVPIKAGKAATPVVPRRALSPFEEMDRLFEDFFPMGWLRPWRRGWPAAGELASALEARMPRVDIIDREAEIVVRAELPGVDKKDVEVALAEDSITIKGSTRKEEKEEKGDYYRCETMRGAFSRTLSLPAGVNTEKSSARFKDGVLEVTLPKMERAKRRNIKVE